ncbi:WD40 repeat-like protein [Dacryopinax primogenitus]|uniref:Probable cytosolic iron-sulfur protein assembly protein 1 n=1 Tax=Dacryopinax primogenitus (strain DJM 731) TaxID=1858805 RepID=M5FTH0_DACPD|nr:WD40 repeat-like protein [Dacryopinax primogenitus]EJT99373.1 WD40 repeat-like protein [Dacryopinax primogenitus]
MGSVEQIVQLHGHTDKAWQLAWNPVEPLVASCSTDKTVRLYSYTGLVHPKFTLSTSISTGHTKTVRTIAWSPDGKLLATGSFDSSVILWEKQPAEEDKDDPSTGDDWDSITRIEGPESECKCVAFSRSGEYLATCSRDKTVWVFSVYPDDYEVSSVLMEHTQDVKCVAWHPKEDILASSSYDDTIKLYHDDRDDEWYPFATLTDHASTVWCMSFSPCGNYLASSSDDLTIRLWERHDDEWHTIKVLNGTHERSIYSVSWGRGRGGLGWLASGAGDGRINVWEMTRQPQEPIEARLITTQENSHGVSDVNAVAWCRRDGYTDMLGSVGDDGCLRIWRITPD